MRKVWSVLCIGACALALLMIAPARASTSVTWHMDDSSGASDPSGHTLSLSNIDTSSDAYWTFDGDGLATTSSDDDAFDPGTSSFTVSVEVRSSTMPSSSVGDYDLVRKGLSGTSGGYWKLEMIPNSARTKTLALCQMTGGRLKWAPFSLTDGQWHTITCTRDASGPTLKITIDGKSKTKSINSARKIANSSKLYVGAKDSGNDEYTGDMDELTLSVG
jgi:hypothetical protein